MASALNQDITLKSVTRLPIERVKEEEEIWISGEELCTEGSSDDDATHKQKKCCEKKKSKKLHLHKNTPRHFYSVHKEYQLATSSSKESERTTASGNAEEPYSWKPTRGSFKLKLISEGKLIDFPNVQM